MKIAYDTLNDSELGTEHWSTILTVLAVISILTASISAVVFDFSFIESVALCVVPVVFISALAVCILDSPTPHFIVSLLLTGFLMSPVYALVGHGFSFLLTVLGEIL